MDIITHYIDRFISFFGAEASLSNSLAKAPGDLLAAFILWLIIKRILTTLEKKAVHFKLILMRKELFAILRKSAGILLMWLVG
jgi:hypothetical protein